MLARGARPAAQRLRAGGWWRWGPGVAGVRGDSWVLVWVLERACDDSCNTIEGD